MRAFWWFKDNSIAGMARPGFNAIHWSDLPIDEGIFFGWLGQYSSGTAPLASFREHLKSYAPKVFPFFKKTKEQGEQALSVFDDHHGLRQVLERLAARTEAFKEFSVKQDQIHIQICESRIGKEAAHLKSLGVRRIVSLTEKHHNRELLSEHFDLYHLGINDLHAPSKAQVAHLAKIIAEARSKDEVMAVHCLAGIGRTSTMLMAAHLLLGDSFDDLKTLLSERNPTFVLAGAQGEFISNFLDNGDRHG